MNNNENEKISVRVSVVSIIVNIFLTAFKFFAGIASHSSAMISDAVHSASDVFSTVIVIIGVKISTKKSDREHPYGHERLECVAAAILAVILAITGCGIGIAGIEKILKGDYAESNVPGFLALIAAIVSVVVKEWMFWYTRAAAKKVNSGALMADAWHHRSDSLSSIGAFIGIFAARIGFPVLEPVASVIICLFIIKAAYDIFKDAVDKMVDKSCPENIENKMIEIILMQDGVEGIDVIKTRLFGAKIYVDLEILVDGNKTLTEAHCIAEQVHDVIENSFENVKHCMIHINPL